MIPENLAPLVNHVWQSTLFVAAVWVLTLVLRKNRAAVRHRLWVIASVKFLVPFSLLTGLGSYVPWQTASGSSPSSVAMAVETISEPFTFAGSTFTPIEMPRVSPDTRGSRLPAVLFSIWICGFAGSLIWWFVSWRRLYRTLRRATPLDIETPVPVLRSPERLEPGVFGIFKPVLVLPDGITDRLSPAQFQAVLAHEFCHVRRRDNLTSAIHLFVEAVFWFHPLVWWIKARLLDEQERACDEEVLGFGGDPKVYAESILKICEFYLTSPLICVSGITGADLKGRIQEILSNRVKHNLSVYRLALLAAAAAIALVGPIALGVAKASVSLAEFETAIRSVAPGFATPEIPAKIQPVQVAQAAPEVAKTQSPNAPDRETFDVASIRFKPRVDGGRGTAPGAEACPNPRVQLDPGRLSIPGATLNSLIVLAYPDLAGGTDSTISASATACPRVTEAGLLAGGPEWVRSDLWDVQATIPQGPIDYKTTTAQTGPPGARRGLSPITIAEDLGPRVRRMLQNLLADRFQVVLRPQTKDMPVYLLTVGKEGFKSNGNNPAFLTSTGQPMSFNGAPFGTVKMSMLRGVFEGGGRTSQFPRDLPDGVAVQNYVSWAFWKMPMPEVAMMLMPQLQRPVLDRTNLAGTFDFHIDYDRNGTSSRPPLLKAIEEVGLKLESSRSPVEIWVIERAEKPTEN
jgi:uncharacterized protein (TIGR03435 family)